MPDGTAPPAPPATPAPAVKRQVTPTHYGLGHMPEMLFRALPGPGKNQGALAVSLRKYLPRAWPGVPLEAWIGFTQISSGAGEDTVTPTNTQQWHEIGYGQTPAGPRDGPAPNPDPAANMNLWARIGQSAWTTNLLGRPATMVPGAWKDAIDDQVVVMLGDLHGGMVAISNAIGAAGAKDPTSTWAVALGFMAFAAGPGASAQYIQPYAARLALVPERRRWSAWADMLDADVQAGQSWQLERHYLPTWRKFEGARQLAYKLGTARAFNAWYDAPRVSEDAWIARAGDAGVPNTAADRAVVAMEAAPLPPAPAGSSRKGSLGKIVVVVGGLLAAASALGRGRRR